MTGNAATDRKRLAANDPPQMSLEDEHEERKRVMVDHMRALADELLHARRGDGITADELRRRAEIRGWIREDEPGRTLSFLSSMLRGLGAVPIGFRRSEHRNANHRLVRVWVHGEYVDDREPARDYRALFEEALEIMRGVAGGSADALKALGVFVDAEG